MLLGSVIPSTLVVILPTNIRLLSAELDRRSSEAERLLARWGSLHAVRSVLSTMGLLLFLYLAIFRKAIENLASQRDLKRSRIVAHQTLC